jgi:hypothetical protein
VAVVFEPWPAAMAGAVEKVMGSRKAAETRSAERSFISFPFVKDATRTIAHSER